MVTSKTDFGLKSEAAVADWLIQKGWQILRRNWRLAGGEIDILARDKDGTLVVVEVRARSDETGATALESIGGRKQRTLRRLALAVADRYPEANVRVDAVTVLAGDPPVINHYEDILN